MQRLFFVVEVDGFGCLGRTRLFTIGFGVGRWNPVERHGTDLYRVGLFHVPWEEQAGFAFIGHDRLFMTRITNYNSQTDEYSVSFDRFEHWLPRLGRPSCQ